MMEKSDLNSLNGLLPQIKDVLIPLICKLMKSNTKKDIEPFKLGEWGYDYSSYNNGCELKISYSANYDFFTIKCNMVDDTEIHLTVDENMLPAEMAEKMKMYGWRDYGKSSFSHKLETDNVESENETNHFLRHIQECGRLPRDHYMEKVENQFIKNHFAPEIQKLNDFHNRPDRCDCGDIETEARFRMQKKAGDLLESKGLLPKGSTEEMLVKKVRYINGLRIMLDKIYNK